MLAGSASPAAEHGRQAAGGAGHRGRRVTRCARRTRHTNTASARCTTNAPRGSRLPAQGAGTALGTRYVGAAGDCGAIRNMRGVSGPGGAERRFCQLSICAARWRQARAADPQDGARRCLARTWQTKPMLGFATPRAAFTAANACSKVWPFRHIRYAMTRVTLLDTPCEQWTNTRPACASASWRDAESPSEQRAGSAAALHQRTWPARATSMKSKTSNATARTSSAGVSVRGGPAASGAACCAALESARAL